MKWRIWGKKVVNELAPIFRYSAYISMFGGEKTIYVNSKVRKNSEGMYIELNFHPQDKDRLYKSYSIDMDIKLAKTVVKILTKKIEEAEIKLKKCEVSNE